MIKEQAFLWLILLFLEPSKCNFFGLTPEDTLKTVVVEQNGKASRRMLFNVKAGPNPEDTFEFPLAIDFSTPHTFIGDLGASKWGINCRPEYCKAGEPTSCNYRGVEFACRPAELTLRVSLDVQVIFNSDVDTLHSETIKVYLVMQELEDSLFSKVGILGLSPNSDFLAAASAEREEKNGFTFYLFAPKGGLAFLDFAVYYQHKYSHAIERNYCKEAVWEIGVAKLTLGPNAAVEGLATLNFETETFFNFKEAENFCAQQMISICKTIDNCDDKKADFSKAKSLSITFKNPLEITVQPEDYLIYDRERSQFNCLLNPSNAPLEFGLKLFERFPFSTHFDGKERYFVLENEFEPVQRWSMRSIAMIGGLIFAIFLCAILTVKIEREHSRIKIA